MPGLRRALLCGGHALAAVLLGSLVAAGACFAEEQGESATDPTHGVLQIDGESVETLTLTGAMGDVTLRKPGDHVVILVGRYCVKNVELADGYFLKQVVSHKQSGWFTVTAERPVKLAIGGPLISTVSASRCGSVLKLDYRLLDAGGREYSPGVLSDPPTFKALRGDRQVGSSTFAYG